MAGLSAGFFKALSGVRRSIKSDTYLSFLRHPRRSQVRPPVVGPWCVTIARPPTASRRSVVCYYCAPPPPPVIARPPTAGRRSTVCYYCAPPPPPVVGPRCVTIDRVTSRGDHYHKMCISCSAKWAGLQRIPWTRPHSPGAES